jgi:hypothetical protein
VQQHAPQDLSAMISFVDATNSTTPHSSRKMGKEVLATGAYPTQDLLHLNHARKY